MAIRAYDLAFAHRHVRRAEHLRAPIFVALEAGVRLERSLQLVLARHDLHDRVAVGAHQAAFFVRAAVPIGAVTAFMAAETNTVVLFRRARPIFRAERDDPARPAPAAARVRGGGGWVRPPPPPPPPPPLPGPPTPDRGSSRKRTCLFPSC